MRFQKPRHKRKPNRQAIDLLCTQTGPEDGIDPRYLRRDPTGQRGGRKTLQLCKQVERALGLVLAAECADPVLQGLQVIAVEPAPSSARLLITVCPAPEHDGEGAAVTARLLAAAGKLRCEIAAEIHRKKAPELAFCVLTAND